MRLRLREKILLMKIILAVQVTMNKGTTKNVVLRGFFSDL